MGQRAVPCMLIRGGTSKGAYFLRDDLPADVAARDAFLLAVMGSPDKRQVDGLGGAHPLTSKVAIVSRSSEPGCDIDFLFAQVGIETAQVDTTPNCGNILAGIGPFALARGLVKASGARTVIRVRTINTGTIADLTMDTPDGEASAEGSARIDGVPGTSAPIDIGFLDAEGSVCGALLPTGNVVDVIDGVPCTLIDNGMPVIVMRAADVGRSGYEPRDQLDEDRELKARIERIRLAAGPLMNLGDVAKKVVPKIALVAPPQADGSICTRSFIPHECHASIGVFAAVSVATACTLEGSVAAEMAENPADGRFRIEHPTGAAEVLVERGPAGDMIGIGTLRTARKLFDGRVFPAPAPAAT